MPDIQELFLSGTTTEIMPIATVDGRSVANAPGSITRRLQKVFAKRADEMTRAVAA
jgi:branched-subunit amino acid aminotransferase/4-amino-4-deoxychorismate lyase